MTYIAIFLLGLVVGLYTKPAFDAWSEPAVKVNEQLIDLIDGTEDGPDESWLEDNSPTYIEA